VIVPDAVYRFDNPMLRHSLSFSVRLAEWDEGEELPSGQKRGTITVCVCVCGCVCGCVCVCMHDGSGMLGGGTRLVADDLCTY